MKLAGLQKLTLLDFPGKMACTIFTSGCNLRCPFCHNADLVLPTAEPTLLSVEEILRFLRKRVSILEGVCITGGEPLLQRDLADLLRPIKELGFLVKLDTNGCFPDRLQTLVSQGLVDYVAMDIKNSPEHYPATVGRPDMDLAPIRESVSFLLQDVVPYEFRTTVVKEFHQLEDFRSIGEWIAGAKQYYLQGFLDSGALLQDGLSGYSKEEMESFASLLRQTIPLVEIRGL